MESGQAKSEFGVAYTDNMQALYEPSEENAAFRISREARVSLFASLLSLISTKFHSRRKRRGKREERGERKEGV